MLKFLLSLSLLIIPCTCSLAQENGQHTLRIMFYNVENLFDTIDTPHKNDEEFLPQGDKHWNKYKYWTKVNNIYRVIAASGTPAPPDIIGFCEVENFLPLYNLTHNTPLKTFDYGIIHHDSPDRRGIDAAVIYRKDKLQLLHKSFYRIDFSTSTDYKTREIVYAAFLAEKDTLHFFANHWPSRRGGQAASEPRRMEVSNLLLSKIDSILAVNSHANIIVTGDFNDEPHNNSLQNLCTSGTMVNLSEVMEDSCKCGTYRYKAEWNILDQFLVSKALLNPQGWHTNFSQLQIARHPFLLSNDTNYGGQKPYRTYLGPRYLGGFSDHLPILLDLHYAGE